MYFIIRVMEEVVIAKLFKNGNSQALRLPKEFRFDGDEVFVYKEGERVIIQPKNSNWEEFFLSDSKVTDDFMRDRKDDPAQQRNIF